LESEKVATDSSNLTKPSNTDYVYTTDFTENGAYFAMTAINRVGESQQSVLKIGEIPDSSSSDNTQITTTTHYDGPPDQPTDTPSPGIPVNGTMTYASLMLFGLFNYQFRRKRTT